MSNHTNKRKQYDVVIILAIVGIAVGIIGWNLPLSQTLKGTTSCTITLSTICTSTVNFSKPFTSKPNVWFPDTTGIMTSQQITINDCFVCPESGLGVTWTSMPFAKTEIFGDPNGQHIIQIKDSGNTILQSYTAFTISLTCSAGSNNPGAYLTVQGSFDLVTWNDLNNGGGRIDISLFCPNGASNPIVSTPATINNLIQGNSGSLWIRAVGVGGGGLGDNPTINSFRISLTGSISTPSRIFADPTTTTISQFIATCVVSSQTTQTCTMNWRAEV